MIASFSAAQIEALRTVSRLWPDTDWCLVGASALGCHLDMRWRKTGDLDLILAVNRPGLLAGLGTQAGWTRHRTKEHEWYGPGPVQVDIVPAGPELIASGQVTWESGHQMSLLGMRHALARAAKVGIAPDLTIRLTPLHVIALLKVVSYLDRPPARERDLADLGYILEEYVPVDDDRRFATEVPLETEFECRPAFLLGFDLAPLLDAAERAALKEFIARLRGRGADTTRSILLRTGPSRWRAEDEDPAARLDAVIDALERGLGLEPSSGTGGNT